ncbi:MAG: hypothetical protein NE334_13990 [Lentisphaeraceae bacterium]|nr:hypothetical protein [Lentisphaeraceae bacterium]
MSFIIPSIEEYVELINEKISAAQRDKKQHMAKRLQNQQIEFINAWQQADEYHKNRAHH